MPSPRLGISHVCSTPCSSRRATRAVAVAVLGLDRLHRDHVAELFGVVVLGPEVDLERTGRSHRVVRRVRHDGELLAVDEDGHALADLRPLDDTAVLRVEVAGQAVLRLVVVLVGVEQPVINRVRSTTASMVPGTAFILDTIVRSAARRQRITPAPVSVGRSDRRTASSSLDHPSPSGPTRSRPARCRARGTGAGSPGRGRRR